MKTRFNPFMILAALGASVLQANAAEKYWTGGSTDNVATTQWRLGITPDIWGTATGSGGTAGTADTQAFAASDNAVFQGGPFTVQLGSAITAGTIALNGYTVNLDNNTTTNATGFNLSATDIIGDGTITNSDTTARTVTLAPTVDYSGTLSITRTGSGLTNLTVNAASGITLLAAVNGNGSSGNTPNTVTVGSGTLKLRGNNNSSTWTITNVASGATLDLNGVTSAGTRVWTVGGTPTSTAGTITNTGGFAASFNIRGATSGAYLFTSSSSSNAINVSLDANRAAFSGTISNEFFNLTTIGATSNTSNLNAHVVLANATRIGNSTIGGSGSTTGNTIAKNAVELLANSATAGAVSLGGTYTLGTSGSPTLGRVYSAFIVGGSNSTLGNVAFKNTATSANTSSGNDAAGGNHTAYLKLVGTGAAVGDVLMDNEYKVGTSGATSQVSNSRIELLGSAATIGGLSNSTTGSKAPGANNTKTIILGNPNASGSASTLTLNTPTGATPVFTGVITDATVTPNDTSIGSTTTANAIPATLTNANAIGHLTKTGPGIQTLSGANTYTGNTLASEGTLKFAKQVSLYNNGAAAAWSNTNINVNSGATMAFHIGGSGEFTKADIITLLGLSTGANGFKTGSILGLDTTSGDFLYDSVIANTNSGSNVLGLTKLGVNVLTLDQTNTFTGPTNVTAGNLRVTGSLAAASAVTVGTSGTLSGTGTVNGTVNASGTIAPGETIGTLTIGATTLNSTTFLDYDLDGDDTTIGGIVNDLLTVNGNLALDGTLNVTGPNFASAVAGDSYRLINVSGGSITNNGLILGTIPTLPDGLEFAVTTSATAVNLVVQNIPSNTYANWLAANAPATGFVTDSDNDGISNGVENVLGTSPNTYSAGLTQVSATATSVTYKHTLNPTIASDITYGYEWSTDLVEWKSSGDTNTGGVTATIAATGPVSGEMTVLTTITAGSSAKLFTRLFAVK